MKKKNLMNLIHRNILIQTHYHQFIKEYLNSYLKIWVRNIFYGTLFVSYTF